MLRFLDCLAKLSLGMWVVALYLGFKFVIFSFKKHYIPIDVLAAFFP